MMRGTTVVLACWLQVGDILQIQKDSFFPADLLLLAVPESAEGIAYVETINLDGESNLKIKKALDETQDLKLETLSDFTVGWQHEHNAVMQVKQSTRITFPGER